MSESAKDKSVLARLRERLGDLGWYALLLLGVQFVGALCNLFTGLWVIPGVLSQSDLGAVLPLQQLAGFLATPLACLLLPVGKYLNTFMARGELGKARALLRDACRISLVIALLMVVYTVVVAPFWQVRLRLSGSAIVVLLCALALANGVRPVLSCATQALKRFDNMVAGGAIAAPLRLLLIWGLAGSFGIAGYVGAQFGLELFAIAVAVYGLRKYLSRAAAADSYHMHWREMFAFSLPLIVCQVVGSFGSVAVPFVIRHRLPEVESAAYYMVTRFSEVAGYMAGVIGMLLFPLVSERFEKGQPTHHLLRHANVLNLLFGGMVVIVLFCYGERILLLRPSWAVYAPYASLMWVLGLIQVLSVPINAFVVYETACRRFGYVYICTGIQLVQGGLIYGLTGWSFFQPYLPAHWWAIVSRIQAARLGFLVMFMLAVNLAMLLIMAIMLVKRHYKPVAGGASPCEPGIDGCS